MRCRDQLLVRAGWQTFAYEYQDILLIVQRACSKKINLSHYLLVLSIVSVRLLIGSRLLLARVLGGVVHWAEEGRFRSDVLAARER